MKRPGFRASSGDGRGGILLLRIAVSKRTRQRELEVNHPAGIRSYGIRFPALLLNDSLK